MQNQKQHFVYKMLWIVIILQFAAACVIEPIQQPETCNCQVLFWEYVKPRTYQLVKNTTTTECLEPITLAEAAAQSNNQENVTEIKCTPTNE